MKFRARMAEMSAMKKFYNILQSMTKLTKLCVMRLSADKVCVNILLPVIS
jgi:hypothetical protein